MDTIEIKRVEDPDAGKTIAEMKAADTYEETSIEKISQTDDGGWSFTTTNSSGLGISREHMEAWIAQVKREPAKGMPIRIYPGGAGTFHGVDIDGVEVFWRTPAERIAERARWLAEHDREQREEFVDQREQLDRDFEQLPDPLKLRIARFRRESPGFRIDSERYELFCCTEAAKFADRARRRVASGEDDQAVDEFWSSPELRAKAGGKDTVWADEPDHSEVRWLLWAWAINSKAYDYDYERQRDVLDHSEGHSGNTFGGAMQMARSLLEGTLEAQERELAVT